MYNKYWSTLQRYFILNSESDEIMICRYKNYLPAYIVASLLLFLWLLMGYSIGYRELIFGDNAGLSAFLSLFPAILIVFIMEIRRRIKAIQISAEGISVSGWRLKWEQIKEINVNDKTTVTTTHHPLSLYLLSSSTEDTKTYINIVIDDKGREYVISKNTGNLDRSITEIIESIEKYSDFEFA